MFGRDYTQHNLTANIFLSAKYLTQMTLFYHFPFSDCEFLPLKSLMNQSKGDEVYWGKGREVGGK